MGKGGQGPTGAPSTKEEEMRTETSGSVVEHAAVKMEPRIQNEIGKHLRALYDDVISEPVPSKFLELLEELEQSTTRKR